MENREFINAISALSKVGDYQKEINENLNKISKRSSEREKVIEDTMDNNKEIEELLKIMKNGTNI